MWSSHNGWEVIAVIIISIGPYAKCSVSLRSRDIHCFIQLMIPIVFWQIFVRFPIDSYHSKNKPRHPISCLYFAVTVARAAYTKPETKYRWCRVVSHSTRSSIYQTRNPDLNAQNTPFSPKTNKHILISYRFRSCYRLQGKTVRLQVQFITI